MDTIVGCSIPGCQKPRLKIQNITILYCKEHCIDIIQNIHTFNNVFQSANYEESKHFDYDKHHNRTNAESTVNNSVELDNVHTAQEQVLILNSKDLLVNDSRSSSDKCNTPTNHDTTVNNSVGLDNVHTAQEQVLIPNSKDLLVNDSSSSSNNKRNRDSESKDNDLPESKRQKIENRHERSRTDNKHSERSRTDNEHHERSRTDNEHSERSKDINEHSERNRTDNKHSERSRTDNEQRSSRQSGNLSYYRFRDLLNKQRDRVIEVNLNFTNEIVDRGGLTFFEYFNSRSTNEEAKTILNRYKEIHRHDYVMFMPAIYDRRLKSGLPSYNKRTKICIVSIYVDIMMRYGYDLRCNFIPRADDNFINYDGENITLRFMYNDDSSFFNKSKTIVYIDKFSHIHREKHTSEFGGLYYVYLHEPKKLSFSL